MKHKPELAIEKKGSLATRFVAAVLAGTLALGFTPISQAAAADDLQAAGGDFTVQTDDATGYNPEESALHLVGNSESGDTVEPSSSSSDEYVYKGYAHGDGSHYGSYSLYTHLKTDGKGTLTGIDLTSGADTFYGSWGGLYKYINGNHGKGANPVYGYLPQGVSFEHSAAAGNTVTLTLKGASEYGVSDVVAVCYSGAAAGSSNLTTVDGTSLDKGTLEDETVTSTVTLPEGSNVNLISVTYTLGLDKTPFLAYACLDGDAKAWVDKQSKSTFDSGADADSANTNRNKWTYYMLSQVAQRELKGYAAYLKNSEDGLSAVDTISGATKTSDPFVNALEEAVKAGQIKAIAENLSLTIDGTTNVTEKYSDETTVTKTASGYELDIAVPTNAPYDAINDNYAPYIKYLITYKLGSTLSSDDMSDLAKSVTISGGNRGAGDTLKYNSFTPIATYGEGVGKVDDTAIYKTPFTDSANNVNWNLGQHETKQVTTNGRNGNETTETKYSVEDYKLTVPSSITHIVLAINIGHAYGYVAYDLDAMSKVQPVKSEIAALTNSSSKADVTAARTAYTALPYDVQGFVTNLSTLTAQEARIAAAEADDAAKSNSGNEQTTANDQQTPAPEAPTGIAAGETAATGTGASAAKVKATSSTEVAYVAPASKSTKKVTVPATVTVNGQTYKVTSVQANAFKGSKATSVTVGNNVKTIAAKAFNGASKLKSVALGKSVTKLSQGSFKGANKLTKVTIKSKKLTSKKALKNAFKGSKVKTVELKGMTAKQKKAVKKAILKWGGKSGITVK